MSQDCKTGDDQVRGLIHLESLISEQLRAVEMGVTKPCDVPRIVGYIDHQSAAKHAQVSVQTVCRWITEGRLTSIKDGQTHLIPYEQWDVFLRSR